MQTRQFDRRQFTLKLADNDAEIQASQRLRYRVFVEELGASVDPESARLGVERDAFDPFFDHLLLIDNCHDDPDDRIVGSYRLLRGEVAAKGPGYYSSSEFDLSPIVASGRRAVELGRSCVDARYRGSIAMLLLWNGVAEYVLERDIEILFGVASFPGTDPAPFAPALSYLFYNHLAPEDIRVRVLKDERAIPLNVLPRASVHEEDAMVGIPPLIKGYLRLGGVIGDGACIDAGFNTIDVCLIVDTNRMSKKHKAFYVRGFER